MRISVIRGDPDFVFDPLRYTVFFNDERITNCVCADDKENTIWVQVKNEPIIKLKGNVRIIYA